MTEATDVEPEGGLPIGALVGRNVARLRAERRWTQIELRERWVQVGLAWPRPKLSALESGRRDAVSLGELVLMAIAFQEPLTELVRYDGPGDREIALSPASSQVTAEALASLFGGSPPTGAEVLVFGPEEGDASLVKLGTPVQADVELAVRLGVPPQEVIQTAMRLFSGNSLHQERDARAESLLELKGSDADPRAYRGHVTRELSAQVEKSLRDRGILS
ncbi:helix-turn-helix transcriptional regulator [Ornithinimicrobium tianjinense]|uniref:helix-turn-helix transcriptional regulator n=1 Tax=Ornithinimicrobium tianjinense TaxID=1195761 RepID=UPI00166BF247|nr:helix-turn-helix transcriptional regulator [Ornithinimicrobium tianjinense]